MFRRLWRDNKITYDTRFRPPLRDGRGMAAAVAAADPDLARQRHQQGVGRPRGPLRRPAVLRERDQPDRALRRADPLLPRALGPLRSRPGAIAVGAGHRRVLRRARNSQDAIDGLPAGLRRTPGVPAAPRPPAGLPHAGGLRRAVLGADRQPGPGHREGAPLPRAVRAQRAAPARRRRRPDRTRSTGPAWSCSSPTSRRCCAARSPTRPGAGAAARSATTPCRLDSGRTGGLALYRRTTAERNPA